MSAMQDFGTDSLSAFAERYKGELSKISRYSNGEWSTSDVLQEACVLILEFGAERGYPFDPYCDADAADVLRALRRSVRSSTGVVRYAHAFRLDQAAPGDEERGHHWLMDRLVADEGEHPQTLLLPDKNDSRSQLISFEQNNKGQRLFLIVSDPYWRISDMGGLMYGNKSPASCTH